jgi:hypothetical protein
MEVKLRNFIEAIKESKDKNKNWDFKAFLKNNK